MNTPYIFKALSIVVIFESRRFGIKHYIFQFFLLLCLLLCIFQPFDNATLAILFLCRESFIVYTKLSAVVERKMYKPPPNPVLVLEKKSLNFQG